MASKPPVVQWILDTRPWFPEATETKHLETHVSRSRPRPISALHLLTAGAQAQASRALALLPDHERAAVLRYYHVRDAKMALASSLLKHYCVARLSPRQPLPWAATAITRDARTKPVWVDPATGRRPVSFNVSHQAGVVALAAVVNVNANSEDRGEPAEVGVDVVCTSERRDRDQAMVRADGWPAFVDMHADVFAPGEVAYLKYQVLSAVPGLIASSSSSSASSPPPSSSSSSSPHPAATAVTAEQVTDAKLRAFYALWALREAYVKLTGEALLAEWLRELEFRHFRPPRPTAGWAVAAAEDGEGEEAQVIRQTEIRFRGRKVDDVNMCLRSVGEDFMIATAVRTPGNEGEALGWRLGPYELLSLEEVLDFAESR